MAKVVLACCLIIASIAEPLIGSGTGKLSEYDIKAGYLFNFTRFVEWPPDVFPDAKSPIIVGILGENPFGDLLRDTAAGKTVNGRAVVVKTFKEGQDVRACHILFVSSSEEHYESRLREQLKGSAVLTVGEAIHASEAVSIITFFIQDNKVRLAIDLEAAAAAQLKISSKVIGVSQIVDHRGTGKNS